MTPPAPRTKSAETTPGALTLEERVAQAIADLSGLIVAATSVPETQKAQLGVLHALLNPKSSYMMQPNPERDELLVAAVRGRSDERIVATRPGLGLSGRAFASGLITVDEDSFALPILGHDGVLGAFVALEPKSSLSSSLALALGAQVGAAWEVARLKDDAARRNKDLQTAVAGLKSLERSRDDLLSNVSHELKNPLTTVKAYLSMLGQGKLGELDEQKLHAVQTAERNADRLQKMVNDLLLISRLQTGKMQLGEKPFGLKALTGDVLETLTSVAGQGKVRLATVRGQEVFLKGDRERLSEAIRHLVEYAIHRSPAGQTVSASIAAQDGLVALTVVDQGPKLEARELEHMFDSFHRPRAQARLADVGLHMPIVAKVAQLHGGKVEAKTGEDGATFTLYLPAFASALATPSANTDPRVGDILLVEDDQDCREVLHEVLEAEGYGVQSVATAEAARTILAQSRPALVLLDLRLSHEDGRSVLHHIRRDSALEKTAVYLISGSSEVASLAAGKGLDRIDGFFEKPLQLPRLLDTIASVVHRTAPQ